MECLNAEVFLFFFNSVLTNITLPCPSKPLFPSLTAGSLFLTYRAMFVSVGVGELTAASFDYFYFKKKQQQQQLG